jgi:hypothetical protein
MRRAPPTGPRRRRTRHGPDWFAGVLAARERVLGAGHPRTLTTRANLTDWTGKTADPAAAQDLFAGLPVIERILGPEHPATLIARANLADWT